MDPSRVVLALAVTVSIRCSHDTIRSPGAVKLKCASEGSGTSLGVESKDHSPIEAGVKSLCPMVCRIRDRPMGGDGEAEKLTENSASRTASCVSDGRESKTVTAASVHAAPKPSISFSGHEQTDRSVHVCHAHNIHTYIIATTK